MILARLRSRFLNDSLALQKNELWNSKDYLVLDMETTGLNAASDHVLSLGWVAIEQGAVRLATAQLLLMNHGAVSENTVGLHMITDEDLDRQGVTPESALDKFQQALADKFLIVHHAPIEVSFLKQLWQQFKRPPITLNIIDTLLFERTQKNKAQEYFRDDAFRLGNCRRRYSLPDYASHNALTDALATAELFLAQAAHIRAEPTIGYLFKNGGLTVQL